MTSSTSLTQPSCNVEYRNRYLRLETEFNSTFPKAKKEAKHAATYTVEYEDTILTKTGWNTSKELGCLRAKTDAAISKEKDDYAARAEKVAQAFRDIAQVQKDLGILKNKLVQELTFNRKASLPVYEGDALDVKEHTQQSDDLQRMLDAVTVIDALFTARMPRLLTTANNCMHVLKTGQALSGAEVGRLWVDPDFYKLAAPKVTASPTLAAAAGSATAVAEIGAAAGSATAVKERVEAKAQ